MHSGTWQRQKEAASSRGQPLSSEKLIDDHVSDALRKSPGAGYAFSALAPEIARSDKRTRALTSEQVQNDLELLAGLLPGNDKRAVRSRAILTFGALVGAMSLARAVSDESLSREIQNTSERTLSPFPAEARQNELGASLRHGLDGGTQGLAIISKAVVDVFFSNPSPSCLSSDRRESM
jgi:hypothetical protein